MPAQPGQPQLPHADDELILVARLYYADGLPQAQIARLTGVSQAKVSRLLAEARRRGIVRISVPDYQPRNTDLEAGLRTRLGLKHVVAVRSATGQPVDELREKIGYFAAPVVSAWIRPHSVVALAGGRTLRALVARMRPEMPVAGVTVATAMGNIASQVGPYDAVEIGRRLARRWSARFLILNSPALLPDHDTLKRLLALDQVKQVFAALKCAAIVLAGVGTLENSLFIERQALSASELQQLRDAGAVGEIFGRFYDARGRECKTELARRVMSMPLVALRDVPNVVAVVAGSDRSVAILGAIRGGLVKSLVIDEGGALALLEQAR